MMPRYLLDKDTRKYVSYRTATRHVLPKPLLSSHYNTCLLYTSIMQGAMPKDQLKKAIDEFLLKQNNEAKQ